MLLLYGDHTNGRSRRILSCLRTLAIIDGTVKTQTRTSLSINTTLRHTFRRSRMAVLALNFMHSSFKQEQSPLHHRFYSSYHRPPLAVGAVRRYGIAFESNLLFVCLEDKKVNNIEGVCLFFSHSDMCC